MVSLPGLSGDQVMQKHSSGDRLTTSHHFLTTFTPRWSEKKPAKNMNNYHLTTSYHLFHKNTETEQQRRNTRLADVSTAYVRKRWSEVVRWSVAPVTDAKAVPA